jgi:hypothetical protein
MKSALRLLLVLSTLALGASRAAAESGTIWSLSPDGRPLAQIGVWDKQNGLARFQWEGSSQILEINLQRPTGISTQTMYIYAFVGVGQTARTSNSFGSVNSFVGPPRTIYGRTSRPGATQVATRGEVAFDMRTYTGQSIDAAWRSIEILGPSRYTATVAPRASDWQAVRIFIDNATR